ncbi:MAG: hypothetical protein Kow0059_15670 [Candidatus Sumerlaeia bacterium]
MPVCLNHPERIAYTRCKTCGKPLCEECMITNDLGDFCSEKCSEQAARFQRRFPGGTPQRREGLFGALSRAFWNTLGVLLALALLVIFVIALWGASPRAPQLIKSLYEQGRGLLGL